MKDIVRIIVGYTAFLLEITFILSLLFASVFMFIDINSNIFIISVKCMIMTSLWIATLICMIRMYDR